MKRKPCQRCGIEAKLFDSTVGNRKLQVCEACVLDRALLAADIKESIARRLDRPLPSIDTELHPKQLTVEDLLRQVA